MQNSQTIVVGVDASEESTAALDWARFVAGPDDRIVVVHAWEVPIVSGYDMVVAVDLDEVEKLSRQGLDELVERVGDRRLVPVTKRGHAGRAIVDEAEHADMVVVGHRGNSRVSLMLGSTANYVAHHTETPVVIVRGDEKTSVERVVVGVDDIDDGDDASTNPSVRALQWAYTLPGVTQVAALHGWFLPALAMGVYPAATLDTEAMDAAAVAAAQRVVDAAGEAPAGVAVSAEVARGTGAFALIEASRSHDLVVVGSRGRSGISELLLGSTAQEVAAHSHSPVAII